MILQTVARQAPLSMEFSRQEYQSGLSFPSPWDLPNPWIEPGFPALRADYLPTELLRNPPEKWKLLRCVRLFAIVHGILQAGILEWVAFPFSRGYSQPRDWTQVSHITESLPAEPQAKPKNTGVGSLSLLQGIFPTQELNWALLHCRWILCQLSYQRSPTQIIHLLNIY